MKKKTIFAMCLCTLATIFCLSNLFPFSIRLQGHDTEKGLQILTDFDNQSLQEVEVKVKQAQLTINTQNKSKPFSQRFRHCLILGDSLAEAFIDYQLLSKSNVLAQKGQTTLKCDAEIQQAISLSPDYIFLAYGMNDLEYFNGNEKRFIEQYTKQIQKLQDALPQTQIYVNSIIPMDEKTYQKHPLYQKYQVYNQEIKKMCQELKITYIDNEGIMNWNDDIYEKDGVHPKYPYYPLWLAHMAEIADL